MFSLAAICISVGAHVTSVHVSPVHVSPVHVSPSVHVSPPPAVHVAPAPAPAPAAPVAPRAAGGAVKPTYTPAIIPPGRVVPSTTDKCDKADKTACDKIK